MNGLNFILRLEDDWVECDRWVHYLHRNAHIRPKQYAILWEKLRAPSGSHDETRTIKICIGLANKHPDLWKAYCNLRKCGMRHDPFSEAWYKAYQWVKFLVRTNKIDDATHNRLFDDLHSVPQGNKERNGIRRAHRLQKRFPDEWQAYQALQKLKGN